jgi:hypothetical protein
MLKMIVVTFLSFSFLVGCAQHLGNFSALATGTYTPERIKSENIIKKNAEGGACCPIILGIPLCVPKVDEAVSKATSENGGDFLLNARLYASSWSFLLFGQQCYKVEGDVLKTIQ